jgi:TPP-dependent pyruvate/acetoin dehydrogenase alpha subunit
MTTTTTETNAAAPAGNHRLPLISNEKLLQLYTAMVKCRIIKQRMGVHFQQGTYAGVGQEAAAVGVAIDLGLEDAIVPLHGDWIAGFVKGDALSNLFSRPCLQATGPDHAAQLNLAISAAKANKSSKNSKMVLALLGDGAASPSLCRDAFRVAGAQRLSILFVCQSTHGAEPGSLSTPAAAEQIISQAEVCGLPCITVDGNDVVAVYRVATEAILHARKGNGPTLIECHFDRLEAHDPILNMENYLICKGLFRKELKLEVAAGFTCELDAAIETGTTLLKC